MSLTELMAGVKAVPKNCQLFQLMCWPEGHKVPTSTNALVELMNMVERWRQRTDYGPVVVVSAYEKFNFLFLKYNLTNWKQFVLFFSKERNVASGSVLCRECLHWTGYPARRSRCLSSSKECSSSSSPTSWKFGIYLSKHLVWLSIIYNTLFFTLLKDGI